MFARILSAEAPTSALTQSANRVQADCAELGKAIDAGKIGDIVAKHQKLIGDYYEDVRSQAERSFRAAMAVAKIGFWVLIGSLLCAIVFKALPHFWADRPSNAEMVPNIAWIGVVSGFLIEFIAGINFVLCARGSKQFSAFDICLERTNRYLLAYKISEEMNENRDATLRELICIMANAPMITRQDVGAVDAKLGVPRGTTLKANSAEGKAS
jgi:hypothetical protein